MERIDPVERPPYLIESVDQAMRLLLLFQHERSVRVTDAARELGVARSTAHRLLSTLAWRGFASQDRVTRSYRAGRVLLEIGLDSIRDLDVRRKAHRHLEAVSASTHETANLFVLEGGDSRIIDGVESDRPLRVGVRTGVLLPAYATAGGTVLVADLPVEQLRALYPGGLRRLTPHTLGSVEALASRLARVRTQGFAVNLEESELGLGAVAVPVRDQFGRAVAALTVSAPVARMTDEDVRGLLQVLASAAEALHDDLL